MLASYPMEWRYVSMKWLSKFSLLPSLVAAGLLALSQPLAAQQNGQNLTEPVYRISKNESPRPAGATPHALDPAINLAHDGLGKLRSNIKDYTALLVKRERIGEELGEHEFMFAKIATVRFATTRSWFRSAYTWSS